MDTVDTMKFTKWCDKVHSKGLAQCPYCLCSISFSKKKARLEHYNQCPMAQMFFLELVRRTPSMKPSKVPRVVFQNCH